jgi:hypothetical protein
MTPTEQTTTPAPPLPIADVDRLADEIAEVASHIDAATYRLLTLIRRFDEGSGWATHGALSCAHWLNWRIGLDLGAARERVRVARALGALPVLDDALRRGAVSYSKTRAITRVATATTEATLLEMAQHATASQMERICRGYRRALTNLQQDRPESLADEEQRRFVHVSNTHDGMVRIEAQLRPEEMAVVMQALDVARRCAWRAGSPARHDGSANGLVTTTGSSGAGNTPTDGAADVSAETSAAHPTIARHAHAKRENEHEPRTALSRADALVAVAEAYLSRQANGETSRGASAAPIELVVHVDESALRADPDVPADLARHHATLDDGTALGIATTQRLACDATVVAITADDTGNVNAQARRTRRISATLRRALRVRDDHCRFPGCTNRLTDAHHILAWARGDGRTSRTCACCAGGTTGWCTSTATGSSARRPASCASSDAMDRRCRPRTSVECCTQRTRSRGFGTRMPRAASRSRAARPRACPLGVSAVHVKHWPSATARSPRTKKENSPALR